MFAHEEGMASMKNTEIIWYIAWLMFFYHYFPVTECFESIYIDCFKEQQREEGSRRCSHGLS
jgi:hypothetical protein